MEKYRPVPFEVLLYFGASTKAAKSDDSDENIERLSRATNLIFDFERGKGNPDELPKIREELPSYYPVDKITK